MGLVLACYVNVVNKTSLNFYNPVVDAVHGYWNDVPSNVMPMSTASVCYLGNYEPVLGTEGSIVFTIQGTDLTDAANFRLACSCPFDGDNTGSVTLSDTDNYAIEYTAASDAPDNPLTNETPTSGSPLFFVVTVTAIGPYAGQQP